MRKYFCLLIFTLLFAGCNMESLLVNDSDLLSVSKYYNRNSIIKPSLKDTYKYLSESSRLNATEVDYNFLSEEWSSYTVNSVKIIDEKIIYNNKYGIVSINATSTGSLKGTKTFTQTWILENNKWRVIASPKETKILKDLLSSLIEHTSNINTHDKELAQNIVNKDPYNITAYGVLILSTKDIKKKEDIINGVGYYTINPSDTEYIYIRKKIDSNKLLYEEIKNAIQEEIDNKKIEELEIKKAEKNKNDNEDRITRLLGPRAANSAIGNEALSMLQYRIFRQSNGSAGYMDYVRSRANDFQDSDGKRFLISALCDGVSSSGNQRLVNANILGIRPMDFDSEKVRNLCN